MSISRQCPFESLPKFITPLPPPFDLWVYTYVLLGGAVLTYKCNISQLSNTEAVKRERYRFPEKIEEIVV
jgi:hypothetical protein